MEEIKKTKPLKEELALTPEPTPELMPMPVLTIKRPVINSCCRLTNKDNKKENCVRNLIEEPCFIDTYGRRSAGCYKYLCCKPCDLRDKSVL